MNFETTPNGNGRFTLESDDDRDMLERFMAQPVHADHGVLAMMLDFFGFSGNGELFQVSPEEVGALTDAPMFTDDVTYNEDGTRVCAGKLWWFPGYELRSFAEELLAKGSVIFTLGADLSAA